jgi:hypothetical protein
VRCGLRRREVWVLNGSGRPVMALVWSDRTGDLRVQPFPPMKGLTSTGPVIQTLADAFPRLPVGPEPPCEDPEEPDDGSASR